MTNLPKNLVLYDFETTGTSPIWDQVLTFGAILIDEELTLLDTAEFACRRMKHIVPHPRALMITGISPDQLETATMSHFEMMKAIHETLTSWGPAIYAGFHSLKFDEEFLRMGLFASLLPPYLTMGAGCSRSDVLTLLKSFAILLPGAITIPTVNGKLTMRLGEVARANGLDTGTAHNALGDVHTTLSLLRLMRRQDSALLDHLLKLGHRVNVSAFLEEHAVFRHSTWFGKARTATVTGVAPHPNNRNQHAVFDLYHDPSPYLAMSVEELSEVLFKEPHALQVIRMNASPILMPIGAMDYGVAEGEPDFLTSMARATAISLNGSFKARVSEALALRQSEFPVSPYIDAQLYSGSFPNWSDKNASRRFLNASWPDRVTLIDAFQDTRLKTHAARIVFEAHPETLPAHLLEEMNSWKSDRLLGTDVPWFTCHDACLELSAIRQELDDQAEYLGEDGAKQVAEEMQQLENIEMFILMLASGM